MSSIIVVFPKKEIATNIRNILVRNGFDVIGVGVTGAQAVQLADNLDDGIVVCGYKMTDMLYNELRDYLPSTIEMLLIASPEKCSDRTPGVISLSMPFKVFDLMNTIEMMTQLIGRRRKKRRAELKNRNPEQQALVKEAKSLLMERNNMSEGPLKDMLVDGIVGGVGGVIVFLPNILILYFCISLMEDSGYMARAAFIMDKIMHKMGLHGKSFIPLIMGFGCNVPAIMASRTIENRKSRLITMLINPLMSCSARLPIYLLLVGAFFPNNASLVLLSIYAIGIFLAVLLARLFSKFLVKGDDTPFVMELPPYRMPTAKSIFRHTWEKGAQYLKKMGGIIMIASIIIWFLGYYPNHEAYETVAEQQENSYIGQLGRAIEPVIKPMGFDWKLGIGLISGVGAKELVVSTLGVLYVDDPEADEASLAERIPITPLVAFCYMLFVLIYFPCIAALAAIKQESGSWKWALFAACYTTGLAWLVAFSVYQIGGMFV